MHVIGIDLSLTGTGIAHTYTSGGAVVDTITTKGSADATLEDRYQRLGGIAVTILDHAFHADLAVIEGPAYAKANPGMHDRSGLWWLVVDHLLGHEIRVAVVPPTSRAKYATGKGNAGKDQVLAAVVRRYPDIDVSNNNEADALVLAAMGARHLGHPIDDLPQTHLAAMGGVAWPAEGIAA